MVNWDEIKQEWETTKITLADLAEKQGEKCRHINIKSANISIENS